MYNLIIFTTNRLENKENDLFKCDNCNSNDSRCQKFGIGKNLSQFWKGENRTLREWDYTIRRIRDTNIFAYHNLEGHPRQNRYDFFKSLLNDIIEILKAESEPVEFKRIFLILHSGDIGRREVEFKILGDKDRFKQGLKEKLSITCEFQIAIFKHGILNPVAGLLTTFPTESYKKGALENYVIKEIFKIPILLKDIYSYFESLKIQLALNLLDDITDFERNEINEIFKKSKIDCLPKFEELIPVLTKNNIGEVALNEIITKLGMSTKTYLWL